HQAFNFDFLKAPWDATAFRTVIDSSLAQNALVGAPTTWVLSNHDKPRPVTRYGGGDGLARARAAALLMLALPGSAYVYQGEELGLPEVLDLPDDAIQDPLWARSGHTVRGRDGCRVPMPWSGDAPPYGFTTGRPWLPMPAAWRGLTVEAQTGARDATLELYRSALRIRRAHPALGDGALTWYESAPEALVFARDPGFVCAINLGAAPVPLPAYREILLASGPVDGALPPSTAVWLGISADFRVLS